MDGEDCRIDYDVSQSSAHDIYCLKPLVGSKMEIELNHLTTSIPEFEFTFFKLNREANECEYSPFQDNIVTLFDGQKLSVGTMNLP